MALNSSGSISLGGNVLGQSANLELGNSASATISFNDIAVRAMTNTAAGSVLSLPTSFWRASGIPLKATIVYANQNNETYAPNGAYPVTVFADSSNNFYILGQSRAQGATYGSAWISKIDVDGNLLWQRNYSLPSADVQLSWYVPGRHRIAADSSGNLYVGFNTGLMKINPSNGNIIWQKNFTDAAVQYGGTVKTSDGNFITMLFLPDAVGGYGGSSSLFIKIDPNGNILWQKGAPTSGAYANGPNFILDASDNIYLLTTSNGQIVKFDSSANFVWCKQYTTGLSDIGINSAGKLIATGNATSGAYGSGNERGYGVILKINPSDGSILDSHSTMLDSHWYAGGYGNFVLDANDNIYLSANDTYSDRLLLIKYSTTLSDGPVWVRSSSKQSPSGSSILGTQLGTIASVSGQSITLITSVGTSQKYGPAILTLPSNGELIGNRYFDDAYPDLYAYANFTPASYPNAGLTFTVTNVTGITTVSGLLAWADTSVTAGTTPYKSLTTRQSYSNFSTSLSSFTNTGGDSNIDWTKITSSRNFANLTKPGANAFHVISRVPGSGSSKLYRSRNLGSGFDVIYTTGANQTMHGVATFANYVASQYYSFNALCVGVASPYGPYFIKGSEDLSIISSAGLTANTVTVTDPTGNQLSRAGAICQNQYTELVSSASGGLALEVLAVIGDGGYSGGPRLYVMRSRDAGTSWTNVGSLATSSSMDSPTKLSIACSNDAIQATCWMICDQTYGVSRSLDGGNTWSVILSGSIPFASVSYGNGTWVVTLVAESSNSASMGYYYSVNNGTSWTFVSYPNAMVYPPSVDKVSYNGAIYANFVEDYVTGMGNFVFNATGFKSGPTAYNQILLSTTSGLSITDTMSVGGDGNVPSTNGGVAPFGPVIAMPTVSASKTIRPTNTPYSYSTFNSGATMTPSAVTLDSSNKAYVVGYNGGIVRFNTSGTPDWGFKLYQGANPVRLGSVKVDSSGNVYVAGNYYNGSTYYPAVYKLNSSGSILWVKMLNIVTTETKPPQLEVDSSGNVYLIAVCTYTYIIKFSSSGSVAWQKRLGQDTAHLSYSTMDSSGNLYLSGTMVPVGPGTYNSGLIVKIDPSNGNILWQRTESISSYSFNIQGIAVDVDGYVAVSGETPDNYKVILMFDKDGTRKNITKITGYPTTIKLTNGIVAPQLQIATDGVNFYFPLPTSNGTSIDHYIVCFNGNRGSSPYPSWNRKVDPASSGSYDTTNMVLAINSGGNLYSFGTRKGGSSLAVYDTMDIMSQIGYPYGGYVVGDVPSKNSKAYIDYTNSFVVVDAAGSLTVVANTDTITSPSTSVAAYTPTSVTTVPA